MNCFSVLAKRCRSADSEVRRLQSKIKFLDEANENLRLEVSLLKNQKFSSKDALKYQSVSFLVSL